MQSDASSDIFIVLKARVMASCSSAVLSIGPTRTIANCTYVQSPNLSSNDTSYSLSSKRSVSPICFMYHPIMEKGQFIAMSRAVGVNGRWRSIFHQLDHFKGLVSLPLFLRQ